MTPDETLLPFGLTATYTYAPHGPKGTRVIALEVRETEQALTEEVEARWKVLPDAYTPRMVIDKRGLALCVSGDGITRARAKPEAFAQWARQPFAFVAERSGPMLEGQPYREADDAMHSMEQREVAEPVEMGGGGGLGEGGRAIF